MLNQVIFKFDEEDQKLLNEVRDLLSQQNNSRKPPIGDLYVTRSELRKVFGVSDRTLSRWVSEGRIPKPIKKGHPTRQKILSRCKYGSGVLLD